MAYDNTYTFPEHYTYYLIKQKKPGDVMFFIQLLLQGEMVALPCLNTPSQLLCLL
jgi:hypothetical protein